MVTGIVIAATVIGIGTWLRWVSRPAVISVRYVLDLNQNQNYARPAAAQVPVQTSTVQANSQGRLGASPSAY